MVSLRGLISGMFFICYFAISVFLFFKTLFFNKKEGEFSKKDFRKIKYSLIIFQLINGISIIFSFEKVDSFLPQLILLIGLILNTISLITFNIKYNKQRKGLEIKISIMSILAIICGIFCSCNYIVVLNNNIKCEYDEGIREILGLETYTKDEAKILLNNIYSALQKDEYSDSRLRLYAIWKDRDQKNTYSINLQDRYNGKYLPPNVLKLVVNSNDKTKVESIYWQFNDEIKIVYYENNSQVEEFDYIYLASLYDDEPMSEIKEQVEKEVKTKLKSPTSAIFTYE